MSLMIFQMPSLIDRLNNIISEEHLKWMLFTKSVDVIALDKKDMTALEGMKDETWNEKKKHIYDPCIIQDTRKRSCQ